MKSLVKDAKITRVSNAQSAGTSAINATAVDMAGFDAVTFIVAMGAIVSTAVTSIKVQQSSDNSTFEDLESTSITIADDDDNELFVAEVIRPAKRYVRVVVSRGTANATVDSIVAIQHLAHAQPVTQPTGTNVELNVAPIAGTA